MHKCTFILLLLNVAYVLSGTVSFEDCGGKYELEEVEIDGCDKSSICVLSIRNTVNISALITASSEASTSLNHEANVVLRNIQTRLDVSPDPCVASRCPINSQAQTKYMARFIMPSDVALNTRGYLEWKIWNNAGSMIVCFRVNIETSNTLLNFFRSLLKAVQDKTYIK